MCVRMEDGGCVLRVSSRCARYLALRSVSRAVLGVSRCARSHAWSSVSHAWQLQRAAELYMDAPKLHGGLSFAEFVEAVILCAFARANAPLLDLHKRSAPRLMLVEHALHTFLNSNVLPLAKSRNLLDAHRTFQEDDTLQRVLSTHADALLDLFASAAARQTSDAGDGTSEAGGERDGDGGDGLDVEQFIAAISELNLFKEVRAHVTTACAHVTTACAHVTTSCAHVTRLC